MASFHDQRAVATFCFRLGKTGAETHDLMSTAYNDEALDQTEVVEWFSRFRNGQIDRRRRRLGRPSTARTDGNVEIVRELIANDRRRTVEEVMKISGLTRSTVQRITIENLRMRRVSAKYVPRRLSAQEKQVRVAACSALEEELRNDPDFFDSVVTGGETWCYGRGRVAANLPAAERARRAASARVKTKLICFFDVRGVVHSEFVPPGQTVDQAFYLDVLARLCDGLRLNRPDSWQSGNWVLHHDNAAAYAALSARRLLAENRIITVLHPPRSPDLAPCDFFLFSRMKRERDLQEERLADVDEVMEKTTEALSAIEGEQFLKCFQKWNKRLGTCIRSNGEYIKRN